MSKSNQKITYFALVDKDIFTSGVRSKISRQIAALENLGLHVSKQLLEYNGISSALRMALLIMRQSNDHIFIRMPVIWALLFLPSLVFQRLKGASIVIEIPTPRIGAMNEIWSSSTSLPNRLTRLCLLFLGGPWALWPATRIIQYADESRYFSFGNTGKTHRIGNGIDCKNIPVRSNPPPWPNDTLLLLAVARFSRTHGYDRLLKALSHSNQLNIQLTFVGDGPQLEHLKQTTIDLDLEDKVIFSGFLEGAELNEAFENAHVAIGALGLHRIGLSGASTLKDREYCARGIPFMTSGYDPEFPDDVDFRYVATNDEDINSIIEILTKLAATEELPSIESIRSYAVTKLDINNTYKRIMSDLLIK